MIITCGKCQAQFKVAPGQIKETGTKVRCADCKYVFKVYRPKPKDKAARTRSTETAEIKVDDYLKGMEQGEDGTAAKAEDKWNADDDGLTPKERRERRRRLYADLAKQDSSTSGKGRPGSSEDASGKAEPDSPDSVHNQGAEIFQQSPDDDHPEPEDSRSEDHYEDDYEDEYEDDYEDDYEDEDQSGGYDGSEYDLPEAKDQGLEADPVNCNQPEGCRSPSGLMVGSDSQGVTQVRSAITQTKKSYRVVIITSLIVVALAVGIYFLVVRPEPTALSTGDELSQGEPQGALELGAAGDGAGTAGITFTYTKGTESHYIRENKEAGRILILTGMARNSYSEPRNFIRIRGILLGADDSIMADRFAYAGNILSEEELNTLPMAEILTRLNIKSGQDSLNMNIQPGQEIPFMLVFDKLPEGMREYRIDAVGSDRAD